jgi:GTP cyclohydrolase II
MPASFDEIFDRLSKRAQVPLHAEKVFDPTLAGAIDALDAPDAVKAGLHLLNDDLARAHQLAQAHEGDKTYDYWHAIVHRREGDFDNAKYWLHRVGRHPVLSRVHDGGPAAAVLFVDRCRDAKEADRAALEAIQKRELLGLVAYAHGPENAA